MREVAVKGQVVAAKGKASKFVLIISHNLVNFNECCLRHKLMMLKKITEVMIRLGFEII